MAGLPLKLVVERGPEAGRELRLDAERSTIGRDKEMDMVLGGDDFLSGFHAEVVRSVRGMVIVNKSGNGTLVNGQPATDRPLAVGDRISLGSQYVLSVRSAEPAAAIPPVTTRPPTGPRPPSERAPRDPTIARRVRRRSLPTWLVAYLVLVGAAFVYFGYMRLFGKGETSLAAVRTFEQSYARAHQLSDDETGRVLHLLDIAAVHEKRGDAGSAYEVYREVLSSKRPPDPDSPAYRYAASRMAELAPSR